MIQTMCKPVNTHIKQIKYITKTLYQHHNKPISSTHYAQNLFTEKNLDLVKVLENQTRDNSEQITA